jgi:hypothetical protein
MNLHLYLDEDAIDRRLVAALRARGVDLLTAQEASMMGHEDEEHLDLATTSGRAIYTFNVGDFSRLHTEYLSQSRSHAGIIIGRQEFSVGDQMRGLLRLIARRSAEEMANQIEFLSAWLTPRNADGET